MQCLVGDIYHGWNKTTFKVSAHMFQPFPKQQILDSSKLKEFADNNFKFNENAENFKNL